MVSNYPVQFGVDFPERPLSRLSTAFRFVAAIPIVVLSADPASLHEARDAQCSDYLPKPFEVDDLMHVVDSLCPSA